VSHKIIDDVLVTDEPIVKGDHIGYFIHRNWIKGSPVFDKYPKFNKFIYLKDINNKVALEHELSHSKRMGSKIPMAYVLSKGIAPIVLGSIVGTLTKKKRYALLASMVASSPALIEEGRANLDAYSKTKDLGLPLYSMGSYALIAGINSVPGMMIAGLAKKK
jgi:hypothetical protein